MNLAHRDVLAFLDHSSASDLDLGSSWKEAREQVKEADPQCRAANASRTSAFVEPFLDWIEHRKGPSLLAPWVCQDHRVVLDHKSPCARFLKCLHTFLNGLTRPTGKNHSGRQIGNRLRRFGKITATQRLASTLVFGPKPRTLDLHGFASWLIVQKSAGRIILYAVYDESQMGTASTHVTARRLEKIFLHEFARPRSSRLLPQSQGMERRSNLDAR